MKHIDFIINYESGLCSEDEFIAGFQAMINDGTVWTLQGHYGRTAASLIAAGHCTRPTMQHPDNVRTLLEERKRLDALIQADTPDHNGRKLKAIHPDDRPEIDRQLAEVNRLLKLDTAARLARTKV